MSCSNEFLSNEILSNEIDCPICMEAISGHNNKVSTECGHCFHTNCLMKSVAHNGFGCPYCRTAMAEIQEEKEDEESIRSDEEEDEEEVYDDYALRGFRFFFNNLENVEHDSEDVEEEERVEEDVVEEEAEEAKPSVQYVTQKLIQQGVTIEHLIRALLSGHDEYIEDEDLDRTEDYVFGQFRIAISNWSPENEVVVPSIPSNLVAPLPKETSNAFVLVDSSSKRENTINNRIPRLMLTSRSIYGF
jgi:hypothetical protein